MTKTAPLPPRGTLLASTVLPSLKVTVPVGFVPVFPPAGETFAANEIASPAVAVIGDDPSDDWSPVVVLALVTVSVSGPPVLSLGLKLLSPLYFATMVCVPAVRLGLARLLLLKTIVPLGGRAFRFRFRRRR